jgi:hypothetical protein
MRAEVTESPLRKESGAMGKSTPRIRPEANWRERWPVYGRACARCCHTRSFVAERGYPDRSVGRYNTTERL